ncbi:MAG TPA: O-methyltransferase [Lacunisphaera sp.]|jgi:predicted O-methyltransferase YrrM|nr:O-methyltransferase [Lacunisphaera sp.]
MSQETWAAVDRYIEDKFLPADPVLDAALKACAAAGLPEIQVTPPQGQFLQMLACIRQARRILEVGTLGGYSTLWLARALPAGGRVVTIELESRHAEVARANFVAAGLADRIDLQVGRAADVLARLATAGGPPFDFVFIDADKAGTADYFRLALRLSRPGTVIVVDNVVRKGAVADPASTDAAVQGIRRFNDAAAAEPRVTATALQTVGTKGYDGFALLLVTR